MKVKDVYKGDCWNCLDNIKLEFRYKDEGDGLYTFRCQHCGVYNHLFEEDLKKLKKVKNDKNNKTSI